MNSLTKISKSGVNIVATLHQPRVEIFDIINVLYLLAPGGRVAYYGPGFGLAMHMRKLGFNCPASSNVSDYVMDVISGFVTPAWNPNATVTEVVAHICDYTYTEMHAEFEQENARTNRRSTARSLSKQSSGAFDRTDPDLKNHSTIFFTFKVCSQRQLKVYYRTVAGSLSPPFIVMLMGILIAQLFGSCDINENLFSQVMSSQLAFAATIQPIALRLFLSDALMREREGGGGIRFGPLYVGKLCGNFMELIVSPLAFVCGYYPFIEARAPIHMYIWVYFLLMLAVTGLTNMCAVCFGAKRAGTIASGMLIIMWAVGGITPTVSKVRDNLGVAGDIFIALTPFRKTFEIAVTMELKQYSSYFDATVSEIYKAYSMKDDRNGLNMLYLVCYWIVTNAIGLLAMIWYRDDVRYWRDFKDTHVYPRIDSILTSKVFIWCETQYHNVIDFVASIDDKISMLIHDVVLRCGFDDGDDGGICPQYLQDFLTRMDMSLDSPCEKCGHLVNEHRRQPPKRSADSWRWSSQARKRADGALDNAGKHGFQRKQSGENQKGRSLRSNNFKTRKASTLSMQSRENQSSFYGSPEDLNEEEDQDSGDEEIGMPLGTDTGYNTATGSARIPQKEDNEKVYAQGGNKKGPVGTHESFELSSF
jgi:hypothetical protein